MSVLEVLQRAAGHLEKNGSASARLDAEVLLAHALGIRRLDLYLQFDRRLLEAELVAYRALVAQRARGEPVAYLVGHKEFMALDFHVTPAVLVPNPDTEVLVQRAVTLAREAGAAIRVADVGTGSGCIAIALAHYAPGVEVWAGDISGPALDVARRNVAQHQVGERVHLVCGNLMEPMPGAFDLICANLPYLAPGVELPAEVLVQPGSALFAGRDGVELVAMLMQAAPSRLNQGGKVLVEVDPAILTQALAAAKQNFSAHTVHRDLGGHERVLEAWS